MSFLYLPDNRFKTNRLTVVLLLPLREDTAAAQAILPALLTRACAAYPDFRTLQKKCNTLYGAELSGEVTRLGDNQALLFTAVSVNDRLALSGEAVTAECTRLLCEMLFRPALEGGVFRDEDVDTEKRCLIEQIRAEINEKRGYARTACERLLCAGQPYAVSRFGTAAQVEALTPAAVTEAWRRVLRTAQVKVFCQGQTDGDTVKALLDAEWARVDGRTPVELHTTPAIAPDTVRETVEPMAVKQSKLVLGYTTGITDPSAEIPALRLMNSLLGGNPQSLLFRHVREEMSLCYYCLSTIDRLKGVLLIDSGVEDKNAETARAAITAQIDTLCRGAFSDEELSWAQRSLCSSFREVGDSQGAQFGFYLGQCLNETTQTPEEAAASIRAVTAQQVIAAAQKLRAGACYLLKQEAEA